MSVFSLYLFGCRCRFDTPDQWRFNIQFTLGCQMNINKKKSNADAVMTKLTNKKMARSPWCALSINYSLIRFKRKSLVRHFSTHNFHNSIFNGEMDMTPMRLLFLSPFLQCFYMSNLSITLSLSICSLAPLNNNRFNF